MKLAWSHAFISVIDLKAMTEFYCNKLGFQISDERRDDNSGFVFLSQDKASEHHQLAFRSSEDMKHDRDRSGHFAFRTDDLQTIKEFIGRLNDDEATRKVVPVSHGNTWSIYFADPEGNQVEIFCDTPWQVDQPCSFPWNPADADETIHQDTLSRVTNMEGFGANSRLTRVN